MGLSSETPRVPPGYFGLPEEEGIRYTTFPGDRGINHIQARGSLGIPKDFCP